MGEKLTSWWNSFMEIYFLNPLVVGKSSLFSEMENVALLHRQVLKG